ncbi:hypothetical protein Q3G72_022479 [Acer saccharum]|nr:hypothetical protein Q3G72_022479 [Acer saccharum]
MAKLEFPKFSSDNPTEWFNRVDQFFEFQGTIETKKVSLASFHLEGEANQWWQWLRRAYKEEDRTVTWSIFVEELWARFGPTNCEDFDEALSQKALVGTFMGGLKPEISEGIRMFKPKSLKEAISLARMKEDQLIRQRKFIRPPQFNRPQLDSHIPTRSNAASPMKQLSWEEMQKRRA